MTDDERLAVDHLLAGLLEETAAGELLSIVRSARQSVLESDEDLHPLAALGMLARELRRELFEGEGQQLDRLDSGVRHLEWSGSVPDLLSDLGQLLSAEQLRELAAEAALLWSRRR